MARSSAVGEPPKQSKLAAGLPAGYFQGAEAATPPAPPAQVASRRGQPSAAPLRGPHCTAGCALHLRHKPQHEGSRHQARSCNEGTRCQRKLQQRPNGAELQPRKLQVPSGKAHGEQRLRRRGLLDVAQTSALPTAEAPSSCRRQEAESRRSVRAFCLCPKAAPAVRGGATGQLFVQSSQGLHHMGRSRQRDHRVGRIQFSTSSQ